MNPSLILCPVAFSPNGKSALARALAIARWYQADLHVLQLRGRRRASENPVATPLAEGSVELRLGQFVDSLNPLGVRVSVAELTGDPVTAVSDYARRTAADLVVVARHGRPHGIYWRPGVYAKEIARHVSCPTLVVPEAHEEARTSDALFTEILCPTDFSSASEVALNQALVLAQQSGGRITLLHVLEGFPYETVYSGSGAFRLIDDYRARVGKIARELRRAVPPDVFNWCEVDTTVVSGVAHRSILATASEIQADLIVIGLPERSGMNRVVMGSTATPVLRGANCPVLVVPANRSEEAAVADEGVSDTDEAPYSGLVTSPKLPSASAGVAEMR